MSPSSSASIDIVLTLPNGEKLRERRKAPVATKADAKRWGQERERHLLQHGRPQRRSGKPEATKTVPTFAEFVPRYLEDHVKANREKPSTQRTKRQACTNYLTPAFGNQRLDAFTTEDVQRLKLAMAHLSPKTLNNTLSVFNSVLKVAEQWGVIAAVPVRGKWVKMTMPSMAFYDFDEYDRLRAAAREIGPRHELVVLLAGDAGVPMTGRLREALQKHHATSEHTNVLLNDSGKPPTKSSTRDWLNAAQRKVGLAEKGPHTLRHTFCSQLAMTGAHVMEIKTLAGHSKLETTQRYMHLTPRALRGAVDRLEGGAARRFGDVAAPENRSSADPT